MKILYALQGTGNGHLARANIFIPILKKYGDVDVLISSKDHDIVLNTEVKFKINGLGFTFGKNGGINYWQSFKNFKLIAFFRDMLRFPINDYDVVINDFEPLTAWLCKFKKKKIIALSHHSSYLSNKVPRPQKTDWFTEKVLKYHSPCNHYFSFHFKGYDANIYTPIIKPEIRNGTVTNNQSVTVYLPSYHHQILVPYFLQIPEITFNIFCKHSNKSYCKNNVNIFTINENIFTTAMLNCQGVICNSGFETPAEAIFLGKKLLCIPMKGQYEQQCNAAALKLLGVTVIDEIGNNFVLQIKDWLNNSVAIQINYPDIAEEIIKKLMLNCS